MSWGPWVDHDGKGCPKAVVVGVTLEVEEHRDFWGDVGRTVGVVNQAIVNAPVWSEVHPRLGPAIIRYRLRRPPSIDRLTEIAADPTREIDAPEGPVRAPDEVPA